MKEMSLYNNQIKIGEACLSPGNSISIFKNLNYGKALIISGATVIPP